MTGGWELEEVPTDRDLNDVVHTADGAYAVGADGVVLTRGDGGWSRVTDSGASGDGRNFRAAATTDDGERVWAVGASGAIAEIDAATGSITDRSAPQDSTNTMRAVGVTGEAGSAAVWVADGSGHIHYSFENGETGSWNSVTPGSGAAIPGLDFYGSRAGHAVDTNSAVYATSDGETWERIGVEDADTNYYAVDSDGARAVRMAGDEGTVLAYGEGWTRTDLGDATLRGVETGDDGSFAVGGGGAVYAQRNDGWKKQTTPTGANLAAVATGDVDVVVGDGGVVLER